MVGQIIGINIFFFVLLCIFSGGARRTFVFIAYPKIEGRGKNLRARRHYKSNWTFIQRFFWVPIFKDKYELKFRLIPLFSWLHILFALAVNFAYYVDIYLTPNEMVFARCYAVLAFAIFTIARSIHWLHYLTYEWFWGL